MSLTTIIIKRAVPVPYPEAFDRFLFVGPHPDDIEIGAGATAAKLVSMGKEVSFLVCLDGRFGLENAAEGTTPDQLAEIRKEETLSGAETLGVKSVSFLGLSDGGLYEAKDLYDGIARAIGEAQPEIVFAPDPCSISECHADHLNVGEAVRRAAFFAPFPEIMASCGAKSADVKAVAFYMTAKPNRYVGTKGFTRIQREALLCHKSQFPEDSDAFKSIDTYLKLRSLDFGIRSFTGSAEGFRVLGKTHMHCLPEAGL